MLAIALGETVTVHYLLRRDREVSAVFIDRVFRVVLPLGVYVCLVTGMLVAGISHDIEVGALIAGMGTLVCILWGALYVRYDIYKAMRLRKDRVAKLKAFCSPLT